MHRFSLCLLVIPSVLLCALSSCDVSSMLDEQPLYAYDTTAVVREMKRCSAADSTHMYADKFLADLLFADSSFLWIGPDGVNREADALLQRLRQTEAEGVSPALFHTTQLLADVDSLRARAVEGATCDTVDQLAAHVEWGLTQAMLRYAYGQRYGYTDPHQLFNHLFYDEDHYQRLFDIPCDQPTDSLARLLCQQVREERLAKLLDEQQPTGRLFQQLKEAYTQALRDSSHTRARLCIINMERARWRYPRPESGTYVWVNLAGSQLTATDTERDTLIGMRVCCGSPAHKSPLLMSNIRLLELNPYWVVPTSIIRKEVVPRHVGDSAYFARNNYHAIDKQTQEQVSPRYLTADQWLSGRYTLRQEKGAGNSLGRMIFRFPNKFAVYLH
ncbi:MAG: L,D-transpeptidase family protein, partial [Bacteroidaceae bacterium]|nr:L,D-transpeptidase family protein [Bacteroidaceae bacterium]